MQGKTNATAGSVGGGGGDLLYAWNKRVSNDASAGDKVLLKRFATTEMQHNEIPEVPDRSKYGLSLLGIIGNNLLFNAIDIGNANRTQTLNVINDDLSVNKIMNLSYDAGNDHLNDVYYRNTTYDFLLGKWLFYCGSYSSNGVNLATLQNNQYNRLIYQGADNIFSMNAISYGNSQNLYKFNETTGAMDLYCTVFPDVGSYYRFYSGMFYKNLFLCHHSSNQFFDCYLKLFKIDPETKTVTLLKNYGDYLWKIDSNNEMAPFVQLCPGYALATGNGIYYCIKLDDQNETMKYNIIDTLGYSGLHNQYYNHQNQTFSILQNTEDDRLVLHIVKFNPENILSFEKVKDVDLTQVRDELAATTGLNDWEVYDYGAVSDNLNRIRIVFKTASGTTRYQSVLVNIETKLSDWTIIDDTFYNYDDKVLTAITTGNQDADGKFEIKSTLPDKINVRLDTGEVDAEITVDGEA